MSDGIIIALITACGALLLGLINSMVSWYNNSKKRERHQFDTLMTRIGQIETIVKNDSKGLQALLRYQLYEILGYCRNKGFADDMDRVAFLMLYEKYHLLGANGVMDQIKLEFLELPIQKIVKPRKQKTKKLQGEKPEGDK